MTLRLFYWARPNSREIHKASVIGSPVHSISKDMESGQCQSKVIEKLVGRQIVDYIEFNQSLKQTIAEFRKGQSTTTVLLRIRDNIIRAMKKGELTF